MRIHSNLERRGSAVASNTTVGEYLDEFIDWKAETKSVEESTIYHYRRDARVVKRYIGGTQLRNLTRQETAKMIADMSADGLAPRSIAKPYRLLRQAMRHAVQEDVSDAGAVWRTRRREPRRAAIGRRRGAPQSPTRDDACVLGPYDAKRRLSGTPETAV